MGRNKEPVALIVAKGKSHFGKEEIQNRADQEVHPVNDEVVPPSYLTKKQKEEFNEIARQLRALDILNETDADAIARYVSAKQIYVNLTKQLNSRQVLCDPDATKTALNNQHKAFNQVRAAAMDLGLTITSRAKLVVPKVKEDKPKENKFAKFNVM